MSNFNFEIIEQQLGDFLLNTINARDLHKALEVKKDFSDWIKAQIERGMFEENIDFIVIPLKRGIGNNSGYKIINDYFLTIDTVKHIAMMSGTEKGREVRKYFVEIERLYQKLSQQTPETAHQTVQVQKETLDLDFYTQQSEKIFKLVQLINSQNIKTLYFADNLYKNLNIRSPLELLKIDFSNYYFIPTELGNFINASPVEINKILESKGLQVRENGVWKLTEKGHDFAIEVQNGSFLQIKWNLKAISE